ncbi:MAG: hypothetical protein QM728_07620 [Gordonia sp. (in: high G+C Gram-positive bacteria)]|uniref:hypothetical protein n=1 Tax=Gordonia sp. (in: high G+C Gram-positive bacteria) TaxID=84139 RepID=UPI0039E62E06
MTTTRSLTLAALLPLAALALTGCDRISLGDASPDQRARQTTTVTTTLMPTPTGAAEPTTTAPTPTPEQGAIPPDGAGAYAPVDASRFQLAQPSSVATYSFSVPSGNIACFAGSEFICEIHDGPSDSPEESRCGLYDGAEKPVRIVGWFNYDKPPCSTILQGTWRDPGPALNYGESVAMSVSGAQITCYSSTEALYCTGPQNYGFKLSRTEFYRSQLS